MKRKIIIDTDPGQDDAVAILLALASPDELEVLGVVAVAGNVPLKRTVANACSILELAGHTDVPVFAGCSRPMRRTLVTAEHVHGPTGLDGSGLPEPAMSVASAHGVDFLIETITTSTARAITLCTLGPLTNVAMALVKAPEIGSRIVEIVMMAGACFQGGNITPAAEFNVFADPEAADVVLSSGIKITMLPLDLTHQVLVTPERFELLRSMGNRTARAVVGMLSYSENFDRRKYGWPGAPLHDPNVIAYLLNPGLYEGKVINVTVETKSNLTLGMTVADWWRVTSRPANATFLRNVDSDGFFELLTDRLRKLP
jgi:purine nucleosidase